MVAGVVVEWWGVEVVWLQESWWNGGVMGFYGCRDGGGMVG